jgi:acyl-CoA synthetase (AMP-forming)/AMP-acid ligase II
MDDTLFLLWTATVRRAPSAVALDDARTGRSWTRRELADAALGRAAALGVEAGRGALRGRTVAFSLPNGAGWFEVFLGLMGAGAVPAPVDPSEPDEALFGAARAIGAAFVWREGRLLPMARGLGARKHPGACLAKLTSGSSGAPKGLFMTHAQMAADGRQICGAMGIGPDDANLAAIPLGYSYGLGNLVVPLLLQGTRVVCVSSVLPHALAADARRYRATVFPAVPPILRALVESAPPRRSFASLRVVISAGSALAPGVARAFAAKFGLRVHGFYGTSETGGIAYDQSGDATLDGRGVGAPIAGVKISFRASERFSVRSAAVAGRGRHSPADRGRLNARGELVLLGRTDRVAKVAGRRVDLAEVEAALRSVPGIRDAFAHAGAQGDGALGAAVVTGLGPSEIRRALRSRIAPWKVPSRILAFDAFPLTARGKTDGRSLRQALAEPRTVTSISTLRAERQMSARR